MAEEKVKMLAEEKAGKMVEEREKRVNSLNIRLIQSGRVEDILKSAEDKEYQNKLFKEFCL